MFSSKLYWTLFYFSSSTITGCVSISAFASLIDIAIGITSSAIAAGIKKHKSIIKKKKNKHDKIVLLAKYKLNSIEVLISQVLIDSVISHDEFVLINDVQKKYDEMREESVDKIQESCKDKKLINNLFIKMCSVW